jgi:ABC-type taurine transport system ATPase subunit
VRISLTLTSEFVSLVGIFYNKTARTLVFSEHNQNNCLNPYPQLWFNVLFSLELILIEESQRTANQTELAGTVGTLRLRPFC